MVTERGPLSVALLLVLGQISFSLCTQPPPCYICNGAIQFPDCLSYTKKQCNAGELCEITYDADDGSLPTIACSTTCNSSSAATKRCSLGGQKENGVCVACCSGQNCVSRIIDGLQPNKSTSPQIATKAPTVTTAATIATTTTAAATTLIRTPPPNGRTQNDVFCPGYCSNSNLGACVSRGRSCPPGNFCEVHQWLGIVRGVCKINPFYEACATQKRLKDCSRRALLFFRHECWYACCGTNECFARTAFWPHMQGIVNP